VKRYGGLKIGKIEIRKKEGNTRRRPGLGGVGPVRIKVARLRRGDSGGQIFVDRKKWKQRQSNVASFQAKKNATKTSLRVSLMDLDGHSGGKRGKEAHTGRHVRVSKRCGSTVSPWGDTREETIHKKNRLKAEGSETINHKRPTTQSRQMNKQSNQGKQREEGGREAQKRYRPYRAVRNDARFSDEDNSMETLPLKRGWGRRIKRGLLSRG